VLAQNVFLSLVHHACPFTSYNAMRKNPDSFHESLVREYKQYTLSESKVLSTFLRLVFHLVCPRHCSRS